jgi:hypothetical protein
LYSRIYKIDPRKSSGVARRLARKHCFYGLKNPATDINIARTDYIIEPTDYIPDPATGYTMSGVTLKGRCAPPRNKSNNEAMNLPSIRQLFNTMSNDSFLDESFISISSSSSSCSSSSSSSSSSRSNNAAILRTETVQPRIHKASIRTSLLRNKAVTCMNCNRRCKNFVGLKRHLLSSSSRRCLKKYQRLNIDICRESFVESSTEISGTDGAIDDQFWGYDNLGDTEGLPHEEEVEGLNDRSGPDFAGASWKPPIVRQFNSKFNSEETTQTEAYIDVQERYLNGSFQRDAFPLFSSGDLNEILRKMASSMNSLHEGCDTVDGKKRYTEKIKLKLYTAISEYQFENRCNGDGLLQLISLAIEYREVVTLPTSFRTIKSWVERQVATRMPQPEIVVVPLPRCWNVHAWPADARMANNVELVINDPIALLALQLIHPRTWALWGTEIAYDRISNSGHAGWISKCFLGFSN